MRTRPSSPIVGSVIRVGGDEFVIPLPAADAAAAIDIAQRADDVRVGLRVGIALAPVHGTEADLTLAPADAALDQAKRSGKGAWRLRTEVNAPDALVQRRPTCGGTALSGPTRHAARRFKKQRRRGESAFAPAFKRPISVTG